jgi:hypothetical protein
VRQITLCLLLLLAPSLAPAQIAPGNAVVAVRLAGTPATQLLAVDLQSGVFATLPRFASDALPPLALTFDPIDRELLLALDLGAGVSRVVRFTMFAGLPLGERILGDVPGRIAELAVADGSIVAAVDGPLGGLFRMPRNGGTGFVAIVQPRLTAIQTFGAMAQHAVLAWSGSAGPPATDPGVGFVHLASGLFTMGPFTFPGFPHPGITGVLDLATAVPRQILSHTDGTVSLHEMFLGRPPAAIPVQPPVPAGGAVAIRRTTPYGFMPTVLGGAAFPHLWTFDPFAAAPAVAPVAGPLPGDPVDFAIAPGADADLLFFGAACGGVPLWIGSSGLPRLGHATFRIELRQAWASTPTILAAGFSDQLGGLLPFRLPSGCDLLVAPDFNTFLTTDAAGFAAQTVPIPNQPSLIGVVLFAQWLQALGPPVQASAAVAVHVGL